MATHIETNQNGFERTLYEFTKEGNVHTLSGLQAGSHKIFKSNHIEKLLKKYHFSIIA